MVSTLQQRSSFDASHLGSMGRQQKKSISFAKESANIKYGVESILLFPLRMSEAVSENVDKLLMQLQRRGKIWITDIYSPALFNMKQTERGGRDREGEKFMA